MTEKERERLAYRVGALLYNPAINVGMADKIADNFFPGLTSMAFCLEDSICDGALEKAEIELKRTLAAIREKDLSPDKLPLLFVRVRTPEHLLRVQDHLGDEREVLTGYVLPKFDLSNCDEYVAAMQDINRGSTRPMYMMPTLESRMIAHVEKRILMLLSIKEALDSIREYVLNIRVGGNDFSSLYGLRRSVYQHIYQIGVIRDILVDIVNVFAEDYVMSGPVWEYFGEDPGGDWALGLKKELEMDRLNGFVGKTAIHPAQIPVIRESMKVLQSDYDDAVSTLDWNSSTLGVAKSADGTRMNEVKCHLKWARKIAMLGDIYGVKKDTEQ